MEPDDPAPDPAHHPAAAGGQGVLAALQVQEEVLHLLGELHRVDHHTTGHHKHTARLENKNEFQVTLLALESSITLKAANQSL